MDAVMRGLAVYLVLSILIRVTGKRSLAQVTTFDLVLVLVVGEATQQALLGEDFSVTQSAVVITTLVALDRISDYLSWRSPRFRRWSEGQPTVLVSEGVPVPGALRHYHLSVDDVVTAAREQHGLSDLSDVSWAVLEVSGGITVIPRRP